MQYRFNARETYNRCYDFISSRIERAIGYIKGKFEKRRAKYKDEKSQDRAARWTANATIWIAIFAVVTAAVGVKTYFVLDGQLKAMRAQLKEMHDAGAQTEKLIDANVKLATAAQKSANTADKNLIATQRAWVGAIDATLAAGQNGTVIKGTISYINSGREPAKVLTQVWQSTYPRTNWLNVIPPQVIRLQQTCAAQKTITGFRYAWPTTGFSSYFIHFQEGRIPQRGIIPWSDKIRGGEDIFVIQGCITYEAFQEIHHTAFCYFYDGTTSDMSHLNICAGGNYVD